MSELTAAFGLRVRELREERGLSQERFALLAGVNRSYMGDVERGTRNISLNNIGKIAQALEVDLGSLFSGIDV